MRLCVRQCTSQLQEALNGWFRVQYVAALNQFTQPPHGAVIMCV